jgi:propionyl-CoA carboxylase beta chain
MLRRFMNFMPANNKEKPPVTPTNDPADRMDYSLDTLVPDNANKPYDMKELIVKVVDDSDFFELQPDYAKNIIIGFGRIDGHPVGIVANQPLVLAGCLDIKSSIKAARFVRFCDAFNIPVVTFVDVPGFMPGTSRNTAASSSTVPSCSTPTPNAPCRRSPSSPARPTAVPTT